MVYIFCILAIRVEGQANTIFSFQFSTPSLCLPSSGSKNATKLYFRVKQHFPKNTHRHYLHGDCTHIIIRYFICQVVSHPVTQHFVTSRVFDDIPGWKTSGMFYKSVTVFILALLYPVTTLINIMCPFKCCYSVANISMEPFVKFVNGAMSFITFLGKYSPLVVRRKEPGPTPGALQDLCIWGALASKNVHFLH